MGWFFERLQKFDWILLTAVLSLVAIGLVAIYSIGISHEPPDLFAFQKQFIALLIGLILIFGSVFIDYRYLRAWSLILYILGAALLLLVVILGYTVNDTQGWFRVGALSFQPVEIAKIMLAAYLAALYVKKDRKQLSWNRWLFGSLATGLYVLLVMLQPDFGSAMVLIGIWLLMSLFAGLPRHAWWMLIAFTLIGGTLLWTIGLKPYQQDRILVFLHPESDLRGRGYNAAQAQIAIGSGGWFGKGLAEGTQARLRFLPEAGTDFMFAVLGEGLGFVGVFVILSLFLVVLYRYLRLAFDAEDDFASLLLTGLGGSLLVHAVVNMGMNLGIMPITGIPLPFLSAAASSLVVVFLSIGIAESVAVCRPGNG